MIFAEPSSFYILGVFRDQEVRTHSILDVHLAMKTQIQETVAHLYGVSWCCFWVDELYIELLE